MSSLLFTILNTVFLLLVLPCTSVAFSSDNDELLSGYNTVIDENGAIVLQTGLPLHVGDQYISEDNRLYELSIVEGSLVKARYIQDDSPLSLELLSKPVIQESVTPQPLIAIYHTHNDESYIPTDGQDSIPGNGSIMLVGERLSNRLIELAYQTDHDKTLHDPHDANAYQRSRRTFMKLLQRQPAALFDIHRDSAPLSFYKTTINGQDAAKILLVVGKQNQNHNSTMEYARTIKATTDEKYKGLIRGIFIAHGNYNQDLNPHSMLVEIGTQYNTLDAAKHSAALFADGISSVITGNPSSASPTPKTATNEDTSSDNDSNTAFSSFYTDILSTISTLLIGIVAYLYLSTGSWQEAKNKLYQLYKYEFTNYLGLRNKQKK